MTPRDEPQPATQIGSTNPALGVQGPTALPSTPPLTFLAAIFAVLIYCVPVAQAIFEKAHGEKVQALEYLEPFHRGPGARPIGSWLEDVAKELASEPRLRRFERELHNASFLKRELLPWYQWALANFAGRGNKKAVVGRDDWLFFGDDLGSAYGKGWLEPGIGGQEALAAIDDFKKQLDARGIDLLLIPSYSKEMLDPEMLSRFTRDVKSASNPDLEKLYAELDRRKLRYVRMDEVFARCRQQSPPDPSGAPAPLALPRDTHWTPSTMAFAAGEIATKMKSLLHEPANEEPPRFTTRKVAVEGAGDLVRMLGLPKDAPLYPSMRLELEQVVDAKSGELVRSDPASDVLLMGDSLTKIFSDATLGLGEGAGFAEHLMLHLDRAIDVIALPGGSATATREALARRTAGLAGKRLVIWQFGVRMLGSGPDEWKLVKMPEANPYGAPGPTSVANVSPDAVTIVGEIVATSSTGPHFDYAYCWLVYEYKVLQVIDGKLEGDHVWVAHPAIVDGKDQPGRSYQVGMKHRMKLDDLRLHFDVEKLPMFDDTEAGPILHYPLSCEEVR